MIVPKKTFLNNHCKTGAVKTENISALTASFMKLATRYCVARPSIDHYIHVQVCAATYRNITGLQFSYKAPSYLWNRRSYLYNVALDFPFLWGLIFESRVLRLSGTILLLKRSICIVDHRNKKIFL